MNSPRLSAQAISPQAKRHIGQILISQGILTEDQLRIALLEQLKTHQPVGKLLVNLGFVSEATLRDALSEKLGLQSVDLTQIVVDSMALKLVPREFSKRHTIFPVALDREARKLIIAIADTNNIVALDQVRAQLRGEFALEMRLAGEGEIGRAIDQYYGHDFSIDGILHEIETGEIDYQSLQASGDAYSQPVVRLISALLADAVERGASDIHFEPEQSFLRIRYRIDGVLRQIRSLHKTYWPAMAVRIKVMSKMNIAETRAPQDGRISLMRQTSINEAAKMDFGNGIRSLMRQDPDVILVGEIRDEDTATMAFRAAMTGHQVYSTLHTNSAAGAIPRLLDIGIVPDVLAGNIIGIVAQRLVRKLCKHCKQAHQANPGECGMVGARADRPPTLYRAVGCDQCEYQGYRGRMAIIEILKMDGELDELIAHRATGRELQKSALARGFRTLADDGVRRVLDGSTALDELMRVVDLTDRM